MGVAFKITRHPVQVIHNNCTKHLIKLCTLCYKNFNSMADDCKRINYHHCG